MTVRQIQIVAPTALPASLATVATVPAATTYRIGRAGFSNPTNAAVTVSVYAVPSGGTAGPTNQLVDTISVAANSTYVSPELAGFVMPPGTTLQAVASVATSLVMYASGTSIN